MRSRSRLPAAVALVGLILYGCGESSPTEDGGALVVSSTATPTSSGPTTGGGTTTSAATSSAGSVTFNETDVFFVEQMIPHHQQAVAMAGFAVGAGASGDVLALAERIKAAQGPEIVILTGWLVELGEVGQTGGTDHGSMGHERMPGMMTDEELAALAAARAADFDRMFLAAMIAHHNGAVLMARVQLADGEHTGALDLAAQIETDQLAQIAEMEDLLR